MGWERAVHLAGPVALFLIALRPLTRGRGHYLVDRRTAWLCLFAGAVWPLSVVLLMASGVYLGRAIELLDVISIFFGGVLFVYGFWALRRVRFSLHTDGDTWASHYLHPEKHAHNSGSEGK